MDTNGIFVDLADTHRILRLTVRLVTALILGGILGFEREREGKAAGLRTHMLVSLGAALFVLVPEELGGYPDNIGRVIQGITTGIGFLGAGTIIKFDQHAHVKGLTTAANIWLTAAVGSAVGVGWFWAPVLCTALAWLILYFPRTLEQKIRPAAGGSGSPD